MKKMFNTIVIATSLSFGLVANDQTTVTEESITDQVVAELEAQFPGEYELESAIVAASEVALVGTQAAALYVPARNAHIHKAFIKYASALNLESVVENDEKIAKYVEARAIRANLAADLLATQEKINELKFQKKSTGIISKARRQISKELSELAERKMTLKGDISSLDRRIKGDLGKAAKLAMLGHFKSGAVKLPNSLKMLKGFNYLLLAHAALIVVEFNLQEDADVYFGLTTLGQATDKVTTETGAMYQEYLAPTLNELGEEISDFFSDESQNTEQN